MKFTLLSVIAVLCFICSVQSVGVTVNYYADSTCLAKKAERSFKVGECSTWSYNAHALPTTPCEVAVECFSTVFEDDMDSCPNRIAVNTTAILTGVTGVRTKTNYDGVCSTDLSDYETNEQDFYTCYKSDIYQNCWYSIELGEIIPPNYYEDDNSAISIIPTIGFLVLLGLLL